MSDLNPGQYDVRVGEPLSTNVWQKEFQETLERQMKWLNHPAMKAYREQRDREWRAKPWYERARIWLSVKLDSARVRLGEIIAGKRFDD